MIVYHGSVITVEKPDITHSYRPLDFGRGFYVTSVREQAVRWARRKADLIGLIEWIDFVCHCRDGGTDYKKYDLICGKVANDRVFRVVDMYHSGIWEKERALQEIKAFSNYDQLAFITQKAIDRLLEFQTFQEV